MNEIINLNKPFTAFNKNKSNEYNIKNIADPLSFFDVKYKNDKNNKLIIPNTIDPFKNHSIDSLNNLNQDEVIGDENIGGKLKELKQYLKK